jgi:hypothetical protein
LIKEKEKYNKMKGVVIVDNKNVIYKELTEQDFYPPADDRTWKSNVEDIEDGDNFADYCEEFFELLDEENYFD